MHCPECGFVNGEGANYCQKCGAFLAGVGESSDATTAQYQLDDESGELRPVDPDQAPAGGVLVIRAGGGRAGETFELSGDRIAIGRSPDADVFLDDVTVSRNHALLVQAARRALPGRPGLAQRLVRQPASDRIPQAPGGRRAADRQVQADLPRAMTSEAPPARPPSAKSLTIGAVCKSLEREFPDISISKIRYLEDQKLLAPQRTRGGYRLYAPDDVQRLRTILRLQRDEFLPLRVIRQELASGRAEADVDRSQPVADPRALRRVTVLRKTPESLYSLPEVLADTGASAELVKELEDYGIVNGQREGGGDALYDETEREIIKAAAELAKFGVGGRNLRVFRTSADREAALLEQILASALKSRNPDRRREAVEALDNLAAIASHLKHLLLVRDLRRMV